MDLSKKYAGLVTRKKLIKQEIVDIKRSDLGFEISLVNAVAEIKKFSAYLDFETSGTIRMISIGQSNPKYDRCVRALADNANSQFFAENMDHWIGQKYGGLELASVFKIENSPALAKFDRKMKEEKKSAVLKGLFIPIKQKSITRVAIFGFEQCPHADLSPLFRQRCLRIPRQLLKNDTSVV